MAWPIGRCPRPRHPGSDRGPHRRGRALASIPGRCHRRRPADTLAAPPRTWSTSRACPHSRGYSRAPGRVVSSNGRRATQRPSRPIAAGPSARRGSGQDSLAGPEDERSCQTSSPPPPCGRGASSAGSGVRSGAGASKRCHKAAQARAWDGLGSPVMIETWMSVTVRPPAFPPQ